MKAILSSFLFLSFLVLPLIGKTQYIAISGKITNQKDGTRMENVNVYESLSTIGTITNKYGFYKLLLKKGDAEIVITSSGFKDYTQKMTLTCDTTLNVKLTHLENLKPKFKNETEIQASDNSENKKSVRNNIK